MSCGCLEGVLIVFEGCLDCVWKVSRGYLKSVWRVLGVRLYAVMEHLWKVFGIGLGGV